MTDSLRDDPYYENPYPEEESSYSTHIVPRRFYVFLEVFMAMLLNFLIFLGFRYLIPLLPASDYRGLIIFSAQLISIIISTVLALIFIHFVFYKSNMPLKKAEPPLKETSSLFTFKKVGMQILFTFLLLFLVYIPLDFLTYALPGGLEFSRRSLLSNGTWGINAYLNFTQIGPFLLYGILLHLMVGVREELFFRGFLSIRTEKYNNVGSSVVISSIFFALSHFTYIFYSSEIRYDLLPAFVWTIGAFFVSSVSAVFILKTRFIWPIILAHTINNVISSSVLWLNSIQNVDFWNIAKWLYLPLLSISILLTIIFFGEVKAGIKSYFTAFQSYKTELTERKTRYKTILADIIFGILFWAIGMWFI